MSRKCSCLYRLLVVVALQPDPDCEEIFLSPEQYPTQSLVVPANRKH